MRPKVGQQGELISLLLRQLEVRGAVADLNCHGTPFRSPETSFLIVRDVGLQSAIPPRAGVCRTLGCQRRAFGATRRVPDHSFSALTLLVCVSPAGGAASSILPRS